MPRLPSLRRFNDLSVARRISVGFGVALALVVLVMLIGLGWMYALSRDIGSYSATADLGQIAAEADIGLRDLEVSIRDHLVYGDDQSLLDATLRHDGIVERVALLDKAVADPADRASLTKVKGSLDAYWAAVQRVIAIRNARNAVLAGELEPLVAQARDRLSLLKSAGGVDSTALASDAAIAVLLMQEHLTRFLERRDPQDAGRMRAELANARGKLAEMNRYLWIAGTQQAITEVGQLLDRADGILTRLESAVAEEDTARSEGMAPNAAGIAANLTEIRQRAEARAGSLRSALAAGASGYATAALWTGGILLLVGLVAVWLIQRSVGRPVNAMASAVTAIAAGRTDVTLPALSGQDEIAAMARAVEILRDTSIESERRLEEAQALQDRLAREKDRAEADSVAKTNFLVNMGHELHGPLTDIVNSSQSLMSELHRFGADELATDVEHIQWTGEQLVSLVDALLDYAKIEAGTMDVVLQDFDINRLLVEVRERSMPAADLHGNSLDLAAAAGLGQMNSDFTKVRQALLNLLDNACKFTEGGSVTLAAEKTERDGGIWYRFTVSDTGRGFPAAQTGRLFQPFVQGAALTGGVSRRGAGLGLTLVGHYTAMLGGDIEVASEPGRGTRITLFLPATYSPPPADRPLQVGPPADAAPADPVGSGRPLLTVGALRPVAQLTP
ncbi:ATP-binding protein [Azospirillum thermophilum]|nr:ATP-binding protein [Azospirillum thermophilum]